MPINSSLRYLTMLLVCCYSLVLSSAAHAQSPKKIIEIATRLDISPYVEAGATGGIEVALIKAIFAETDFEPVFVQQPRVRMISAFESRQINGIITQNQTASSEGCATDWYISHQNVALTVAERNVNIDNLNDLAGHSVLSFSGATRYLGDDFRKTVMKTTRYTESGDQSKHISLLYKGRFDAIVGDRWILALAQKRYLADSGEYKTLTAHPIMKPSLYVARFHNQEVCDAFNLGLRRLRASGDYARIIDGFENNLASIEDAEKVVPHP